MFTPLSLKLVRTVGVAFVAGLLLFGSTSSCFALPEKLKSIRVVMDDNYPPYVFKDEQGGLQGVIVDQWRLWQEKTGIRVELSGMDWADAQRLMQAGEFEVIDTIFRNEQREKFYEFTAPYAEISVPLFFHEDISGIRKAKDARGFVVAVKAGEAAIEILHKNGVSNLIEYPSYEKLIAAARDGQVKVFTVDRPPALYFLNKMGIQDQFRETAPMYSGEFHRAVAKGRKDLLATIEVGFARITADEYQTLDQRWMGRSLDHMLPSWVWPAVIAAGSIFGLTLFAVSLLILFNRKLHEKVTQATQDLQVHAGKLEKINEDLAKRNKELDEFTYIASHDLQEPLRKISAFSSLLKADMGNDLSEDTQENLDFLTAAAARMQTLIDDLLELSRSGRRTLQRTRFPLDTCIDTALESLAIQLEESGVRIVRDELPEIWGDQTILTQLYQNLINNAIKFTDQETPVVKLTAEQTEQGLVLGVSDNGIGIAKQYQQQIFTPFKRLHGRDDYGGTGIGLAICHKAVTQHAGKIWVESAPGQGSHFKFILWSEQEEVQ